MKSVSVQNVSNYLKLGAILCLSIILGACSDSTKVVGDPGPIIITQPPETPDALGVIVNGVILESGTTNIISEATISFYEDGQVATNILDVDSGEGVPSTAAENGSFQVAIDDVNSVDEFTVKVSALDYFDKLVSVSIPDDAQVVQIVVELLSSEIDAVSTESLVEEVNGSTVAADISLSSDDETAADTTIGKGEVLIPQGIQFVDENDTPIEVTSVKLEVSFIESQEAETPEEESVSIAELIPEGLNSDDAVEEVLVPIGLTEVNLTDQDGTPIKNFDGNITVTIYLPDTTIDPSTGNPISESSNLRVRTYDTDTLTWTTEPEDAVSIRAKNSDGLFPVDITVNHLTIFALTAEVAACTSDVTFNFTGDAVPDSGLDLFVEVGDLREKFSITPAATELKIAADAVKNAGIMKDEDSYSIFIGTTLGDSWVVEDTSVAEPVVIEPSLDATITAPQSAEAIQNVYVSNAELSDDGTQITVTVSYLADDPNLTGVGFSLNFDSNFLTLSEVSDLLPGAIAAGSLTPTGDGLKFGWASIFGQFPGTESALLTKVTFDIVDGASGATNITFVETSKSANHTLVLQQQELTFTPGSDGTDTDTDTDGYQLCADEAIVVELKNPTPDTITLVDEDLTLTLQCSDDETVETPLTDAIVTYSSDTNPIPVIAAENSGTYQLVELDTSASYTVSVNTRSDAGVKVFTDLQVDGADEDRAIEVECISVTGTGSN